METIYYTSFKVLTGNFWIALTDEGIIQASIHNTEEQFMKDLKRRVKGTYVHAPEKFTKLQAQLAAYFKGKLQTFNYKTFRETDFIWGSCPSCRKAKGCSSSRKRNRSKSNWTHHTVSQSNWVRWGTRWFWWWTPTQEKTP